MSLSSIHRAHLMALANLHAACFESPWDEAALAELLASGAEGWMVSSVASEAPAPPCGFILLRAAADEAEILTLAVTPEQRRRGYASALLKEAMEMLARRGIHTLFLEVRADKPEVRCLYEQHGFTQAGTRPGYYRLADGSRADALLMRRVLMEVKP